MQESIKTFQTNVNVGGHVWKHIYGLQSKPHGATESQYGVSMFKAPADFSRAWNRLYGFAACNYRHYSDKDCVNARALKIYSAYQCTRTYATYAGICDRVRQFTPNKVVFRYNKINNRWILKTAYPAMSCGTE